ncbi:MAG: HD domain-containing protein [Spirochaetales bacterium]|nr:HD domain-containing protein [Spirochaetales bacterium]
MEVLNAIQLSRLIDMSNPGKVLNEIKKIFCHHYPANRFNPVKSYFVQVKRIFEGKFKGYKRCNTYYHDFKHTLDTLLASARILDGYNLKEKPIPVNMATNLLAAALFHDVGYIQEEWDNEGTGAKFTKYHIQRSVEFLLKHQDKLRIDKDNIEMINRFIRCTGFASEMLLIKFLSEQERITGAILGTADLMGQMSDRTYLEKLLFLYYEFKEAEIEGYETEFDVIKKTIDFYEMTKEKFKKPLMKMNTYVLYHFNKRYDIHHDLYGETIERHINYIKRIISDSSTNFRRKLNRANWVEEYVYS